MNLHRGKQRKHDINKQKKEYLRFWCRYITLATVAWHSWWLLLAFNLITLKPVPESKNRCCGVGLDIVDAIRAQESIAGWLWCDGPHAMAAALCGRSERYTRCWPPSTNDTIAGSRRLRAGLKSGPKRPTWQLSTVLRFEIHHYWSGGWFRPMTRLIDLVYGPVICTVFER